MSNECPLYIGITKRLHLEERTTRRATNKKERRREKSEKQSETSTEKPYGTDTVINRMRGRHSDAVDKSASKHGRAVGDMRRQETQSANSEMESGQTAQI